MASYNLQTQPNKLRSAAALVVHAAWIVSPLIVIFMRRARWHWIAAAIASAAAAFYDPNPLFWLSIGCGVLLLASAIGRDFLQLWVLIFFAASAFLFFAGSARYLLPMAAPVAILAVRACNSRILVAGFALQMALSFALAVVNYQHWDAYRRFAASISKEIAGRHAFINAEWGLRYYLESEGALPITRDQQLQPGDLVISSALALPLELHAPLAPLAQIEIRPSIPLRLISLDRRSAYSSASDRGLLPFEISRAPIDRVRADIVTARNPRLTWIDPSSPAAAPQIVSGLFADGWTSQQAAVVLKSPDHPEPLRAQIYIPDPSPARRVTLSVDGRTVADQTFAHPGVYTITVDAPITAPSVTVTLTVDRTFSTAQDRRKLGIVVTKIGYW